MHRSGIFLLVCAYAFVVQVLFFPSLDQTIFYSASSALFRDEVSDLPDDRIFPMSRSRYPPFPLQAERERHAPWSRRMA
jgi:hypothetical protein